jgi:hypothetical protein
MSGAAVDLTGKIGADDLGHRLVGQDDIEALRRFAERIQRCPAGVESAGS